MQLAESGRAEDFVADLRARADRSLYFFTKVILGYKDLVDHYHIPFCEAVQDRSRIKRGFLRPRGTFKSTVISKAYPLWRLAKDPCERILIASASAKVAKKPLRDIKWHILNNQLFQAVYPELIPPDINKITWTETEILLPRAQSFDECSITTTGVETSITGFHYTLIIPDDIIGEDEGTAPGEADMLRAIEWLKAMPGLKVHPKTSEEVYGGTRWKDGEKDCYGWLMAHDPDILWNVEGAINDDGEPLFPERLDLDTLAAIRKRMGDYLYFCNYMNNPIAPEGVDYPGTKIKSFKPEKQDDGGYVLIPDDGTPPVRLESLIRMSFYDPSAGGKSATAENAIATGGMSSDKRVFIFECRLKNCGVGEACELWLKDGDRFRPYKDMYELVGAQKSVEDIIKLRNSEEMCPVCKKKHRRLTPVPVKPGTQNKHDRIRLFAGSTIDDGRLYLRQGLDKLRRQITSFPNGDLVDGFDAVAYLCNKLYPPPSDEYLAEERERDEQNKNLAHNPRIDTEHQYGGYV